MGTQASKPQISVAVRHCETPVLGFWRGVGGRVATACVVCLVGVVGMANFLNRCGVPGRAFQAWTFSSAIPIRSESGELKQS
jgi:hypothetical protein